MFVFVILLCSLQLWCQTINSYDYDYVEHVAEQRKWLIGTSFFLYFNNHPKIPLKYNESLIFLAYFIYFDSFGISHDLLYYSSNQKINVSPNRFIWKCFFLTVHVYLFPPPMNCWLIISHQLKYNGFIYHSLSGGVLKYRVSSEIQMRWEWTDAKRI